MNDTINYKNRDLILAKEGCFDRFYFKGYELYDRKKGIPTGITITDDEKNLKNIYFLRNLQEYIISKSNNANRPYLCELKEFDEEGNVVDYDKLHITEECFIINLQHDIKNAEDDRNEIEPIYNEENILIGYESKCKDYRLYKRVIKGE